MDFFNLRFLVAEISTDEPLVGFFLGKNQIHRNYRFLLRHTGFAVNSYFLTRMEAKKTYNWKQQGSKCYKM